MGSSENKTTLRLLYYPVVKNLREGQLRLGEHTDYGTITLLFQDQVGGLEVKLFKALKPVDSTCPTALIYIISSQKHVRQCVVMLLCCLTL